MLRDFIKMPFTDPKFMLGSDGLTTIQKTRRHLQEFPVEKEGHFMIRSKASGSQMR